MNWRCLRCGRDIAPQNLAAHAELGLFGCETCSASLTPKNPRRDGAAPIEISSHIESSQAVSGVTDSKRTDLAGSLTRRGFLVLVAAAVAGARVRPPAASSASLLTPGTYKALVQYQADLALTFKGIPLVWDRYAPEQWWAPMARR